MGLPWETANPTEQQMQTEENKVGRAGVRRAARGPPGRGFPEEGGLRGRCSEEGLRQGWASGVSGPKEVGGRDGVPPNLRKEE